MQPSPDPVFILRGSTSPVTSVNFLHSSADTLLSGNQDGKLHVWDLKTRRIQQQIDAHVDSVLQVEPTPTADSLLTHGRDGYVKVWRAAESLYTFTDQVQVPSVGFCAARVLPQAGRSYLIGLPGESSQVTLYDTNTKLVVRELVTTCSKLGMCMCMHPVLHSSGTVWALLVGYENGSLLLWDIASGKLISQLMLHHDAVMCLGYSSSANKGFSGSVDNQLLAWTASGENNPNLSLIGKAVVMNPGFNAVVIRSDDKIVATAGWDSNIRIFSLKKLRPLVLLSFHRESVQALSFSQGSLLAAGSKDRLISVWDIYR